MIHPPYHWGYTIGVMDDATAEENAIRARFKHMPCRKCGKLILVGIRARKRPIHIECGIEESIEAARQMREKRGPYYDRWLHSMERKFAKSPGGGVSPTEGEG